MAINVNSRNFLTTRKEIWNGTPDDIRCWVRKAIRSTSLLNQLYRYYGIDPDGKEVSIEEDVARASEQFRPGKGILEEEALYALRVMWRFLMRNYAVPEARQIDRVLRTLHEPAFWRTWRNVSYCFPQLAVAVAVGYLVLTGCSTVLGLLGKISQHTAGVCVCAALALTAAFFLGMADVQRRVGRRLRVMLCRSGWLFLVGVAYTSIGFFIHWFLWWYLDIAFDWKYALLISTAALPLGFLFQLFWQEQSIGEPL